MSCGVTNEQPAMRFAIKNRKIAPLGTWPPKKIKFDPASWIYCQPFEIASRSSLLLRDPPEGSLSPLNWLPLKMLPKKPPETGFSVAERPEDRLLEPFEDDADTEEIEPLASERLDEDLEEEESSLRPELLLLPELLLPDLLPPELELLELFPPELLLSPLLPPPDLPPPLSPPPVLLPPPPPELLLLPPSPPEELPPPEVPPLLPDSPPPRSGWSRLSPRSLRLSRSLRSLRLDRSLRLPRSPCESAAAAMLSFMSIKGLK